MIISKELLSAVLGAGSEPTIYEQSMNFSYGAHIDGHGVKVDSSNSYYLECRCKEWLYEQGVTFDVKFRAHLSPRKISVTIYGDKEGYFSENTEPEAIFAACQWKLDQEDRA